MDDRLAATAAVTAGCAAGSSGPDEVLPFRVPAALSRTIAVVLGAGFAWALDYSVFTTFGQDLRSAWMHSVATGLALVGGGEFVKSLVKRARPPSR